MKHAWSQVWNPGVTPWSASFATKRFLADERHSRRVCRADPFSLGHFRVRVPLPTPVMLSEAKRSSRATSRDLAKHWPPQADASYAMPGIALRAIVCRAETLRLRLRVTRWGSLAVTDHARSRPCRSEQPVRVRRDGSLLFRTGCQTSRIIPSVMSNGVRHPCANAHRPQVDQRKSHVLDDLAGEAHVQPACGGALRAGTLRLHLRVTAVVDRATCPGS